MGPLLHGWGQHVQNKVKRKLHAGILYAYYMCPKGLHLRLFPTLPHIGVQVVRAREVEHGYLVLEVVAHACGNDCLQRCLPNKSLYGLEDHASDQA